MPILSALYLTEEKEIEVTPAQIKVHLYELQYKGNLYCTTTGCNARIVYVHRAESSYFRTWKHENHIETCLHKFHREPGGVGSLTEQVIYVEASRSKKGKALDEAFELAKLTEEERQAIRANNRKNKSTATSNTENRPNVQLVLFDGMVDEELRRRGVKSPPLYKKSAASLKDTDVGKVKLVYGLILEVEHKATWAVIHVDGGNKTLHIRFEEAFFSINPQLAGLFHHVHRFCTEHESVIFTGIGEVQRGRNGDFELFIFDGDDFKIQNSTLRTLAAQYSSGLFG